MTKTIGGRVYSFGILPPTTAITVEVRIAAVIGEPLFKALVGVDESKLKNKEGLKSVMMAAVGMIASRMNPEELIETMETAFKYVTCDGKRFTIDEHFVGRNKEVWEVFIEALRHNFADFLPASLFDSPQGQLAEE